MSSNEATWLKEELLRVFDSVSRREFNQNPDLGLRTLRLLAKIHGVPGTDNTIMDLSDDSRPVKQPETEKKGKRK